MVVDGADGVAARTLVIDFSRSPSWGLTKRHPYVEFANMGTNEPRLTQQTIKVLGALISGHVRELSGADIAKLTKLQSGTLYPILYRLEQVGWVNSNWEAGDPAVLGRPRRRYYRVTAQGAKKIKAVVRELTPSDGRAVWAL
jgi:PadR family transcriptional regulator, regulatory protein PadR